MRETVHRRWLPVLLVVACAVTPYLGVLHAPFVFDDLKLVRDDRYIRDFSVFPACFDIFSRRWDDEELRPNYRPLRFLSYAIDYQSTRLLYGDFKPESMPTGVFHAVNLILHALNALLLLGIARILLGNGPAAMLLALLFAVHPVMTEAVTYVSSRRDVLSTLFFLAALRVSLGQAPAAALVTVPLLFVLGLLTKEMVVTLPAVILLIDLARRARFEVLRVALLAILFALAIGFTYFEATHKGLVAGAPGGSRTSALLTAPRYLARYLALLLLPGSQSIDYSFDAIPVSRSLLEPWTTLTAAGLLVVLVAGGLIALVRRRFALAVGLLWFVGTLTPVLQIVPIPERFAERFAYLPAIGVLLVAAAVFRAALARWPAPASGAAGTAVVLLASLAWMRNADWATPEALWGSAARAQPMAARAHLGYGHALRDGGKLRDAAREYGLCLAILGDRPPERLAEGRPLEARTDELLHWGQVLQARAFRAEVLGKLGAGNEGAENYPKAIEDYRWILAQRDIDGTAIAGSPRFLVTRFNLANCLLGLSSTETAERAPGLRAEAAEEFRKVAEGGGDPSLARAARYFRSKIALIEGRSDDALRELEDAFRMARESGDRMDRYRLAGELSDLLVARKDDGRADDLLRDSIAELGNLPERKDLLYRRSQIADRRGDLGGAIRILEDCLEIDPRYGPALLTLAGMELNRGNLDRADELYRRLLQAAPGEPRALKGLNQVQLRRSMKDRGKDAPPGDDEEKARVLVEGLIQRGEGHLEKKQLLAAAEPLRKAVEAAAAAPDPAKLAPQKSRALWRLGAIARELHEFPRAQDYLKEAVTEDSGNREALRDLADLQLRDLHDRKSAEATYQEYLDALPSGAKAESYVYVNLASLVKDRSPSRAIDLYRAGKAAGFTNPQAARTVDLALGYLLAEVGRHEEALECLTEYLDQSEAEAQKDPLEAARREEARKFLRDRVLPHISGGAPADRKETGKSP